MNNQIDALKNKAKQICEDFNNPTYAAIIHAAKQQTIGKSRKHNVLYYTFSKNLLSYFYHRTVNDFVELIEMIEKIEAEPVKENEEIKWEIKR